MVNTLANHGFLPHDGLDVSMADLIVAFSASVNLASAATQLVGAKALTASTTGNASTFNLDDINKHGIIEHDGSLSRADVYFGDNHSFNSTIWNSVAAFFTADTIDVATAAAARKARIATATAENPTFNMSATDIQFSFIESALYLGILGNITAGVVPTKFVTTLFQEERLPYEEGWTRSAEEITAAGVLTLASLVGVAST